MAEVSPPTRAERIELVAAKAREHGIEPWEFLGGAIAESGHGLDQWERYGTWPDVSFGLFHQTVRFADEGDHTASPENVRAVRERYFDPRHACDVAARKFLAYRALEQSALDAWCRYNWPARSPSLNPNRGNYAQGLDEARRVLGVGAVPVSYNPAEPPHRQEDDFDCSQETAEWALWSVSRRPQEAWLEPTMIAEGVMSPEVGLTDASGAGLAAFLNRHYGEFGYHASHEPIATFDALAAEAGRYPLLIGGRNWGGPGRGHWSGLAGYDAAGGVLDLRNPATGPTFGHPTLTRAEFDARGPWSLVRLTHPDLLAAPPPPPPDPRDGRIAELEAEVATLWEERNRLVTALAVVCDDRGDDIARQVDQLREIRRQFIGERP